MEKRNPLLPHKEERNLWAFSLSTRGSLTGDMLPEEEDLLEEKRRKKPPIASEGSSLSSRRGKKAS